MKTYKKLIFLSTPFILYSYANSFMFDDFWNMDSFFDDQIKMMQEMRDNMRKTQEAFKVNFDREMTLLRIETHDQNDMFIIEVMGVEKLDTYEAMINDDNDMLTITTPYETVKIMNDGVYTTIQASKEMKKEQEKKDDNEKNEEKQSVEMFFSASSSSTRIATGPLLFEQNPEIKYNPQSKTLKVSIVKSEPKKIGKPVSIIIENDQEPTDK